MTQADDDPRVIQLHDELLILHDALYAWLNQNLAYSAAAIFFLSGALQGLILEGWPDQDNRPPLYTQLLEAIDHLGAELGPMLATVEADGNRVIRPRPRKTGRRQPRQTPLITHSPKRVM